MSAKFAGADWIKDCFKVEMSPLGQAVADLLGDLFGGIYHLDYKALGRVDWANNHHIIFISGWSSISTFDSGYLTRLVFICHDRAIRCTIRGIGPNYLELMFHQRQREGGIWERHPTIEQALAEFRKSHPIEEGN